VGNFTRKVGQRTQDLLEILKLSKQQFTNDWLFEFDMMCEKMFTGNLSAEAFGTEPLN
jgi:hypothetical protein